MTYLFNNYFLILASIIISSVSSTLSETLTIPLNKSTSILNRELYSDFIYLNRSSTLKINFTNPSKNLSFIILQVHSHLYNVTLYNNVMAVSSEVIGKNIGMYSSVKKLDTFLIFNQHEYVDLKLLATVFGYRIDDPIPGGCNMEFPLPTTPFLQTSYTKDTILVEAAAPKNSDDPKCMSTNGITFYRLFLQSRDFTEDGYFDGLKSMMSLEKILENGSVLPQTGFMWNMRRLLAAYPGTGSIYVAVAYSDKGYSVYIPTASYACDPSNQSCYLFDDALVQLICAGVLFVGVFVCFFGHKYFIATMFIVGMSTGGLVTYIVLSLIVELDSSSLLCASLLTGTFVGAIWVLFWWMYGIPIVAVLLHTINLGFLVSSIVYYRMPGGITALEEDLNFWILFVTIMILTSAMFISISFISNILCCCILGGYAIVYPIDCYLGSNLKYILINIVRRAVVPKFNWAVVAPPYEIYDALLTLLWTIASISGFLLQHYRWRRRAPFPPPPRAARAASPLAPPPPPRRQYDDGADAPGHYGALSRSVSTARLLDKDSSRPLLGVAQPYIYTAQPSAPLNERTPLFT